MIVFPGAPVSQSIGAIGSGAAAVFGTPYAPMDAFVPLGGGKFATPESLPIDMGSNAEADTAADTLKSLPKAIAAELAPAIVDAYFKSGPVIEIDDQIVARIVSRKLARNLRYATGSM